MMKKKLTAFLLSCAMILTACAGEAPSATAETAKMTETETPQAETTAAPTEEMTELSSMELVSRIKIGWNLGDTLDVCQADRDGDGRVNEHVEEGEEVDETLWGNPPATKELFEALWESGVNAVRIPVTWRDHIDEAGNVNEAWLERVREVVDYAYDLGMIVIINIHHDGGGDPDFGAWICHAATDFDGTLARYETLWGQIAERFRDYGERLIFESMNEVGFDALPLAEAYETLNALNRAFVELIRASGGNNARRHLLIAGYWTDIAMTCDSRFVLPDDPAGRLIVSVHYYTPWDFCTTNIKKEWGTAAEQRQMEELIGRMKTTFVDQGVPVIVGEYAASGDDFNSCVFFCEKLVKLCHDYGIGTFLWDNGNGQVDRKTGKWRSEQMLNALTRAVSGEEYTPEKAE
ncbi:MAG: glycoside hydrolase family 5 protein [Bacteroides sp.]|nr:glycoside hydrolase family 5 protein [Eubacterium sp.]MCM1417439.1 glycoside hydrolase family 5 protein [Roseburia sp.]MCM1461619.1 glycoside hydrolase family 5 protein [Bacteroides sp.]